MLRDELGDDLVIPLGIGASLLVNLSEAFDPEPCGFDVGGVGIPDLLADESEVSIFQGGIWIKKHYQSSELFLRTQEERTVRHSLHMKGEKRDEGDEKRRGVIKRME